LPQNTPEFILQNYFRNVNNLSYNTYIVKLQDMKKTDVLFGSATVCKRAIGQKYQLTINCGGFSSKSSEECHELHIELALKKTLKQVYQSAFMANCGAMTV
jgi:hypothetical protein